MRGLITRGKTAISVIFLITTSFFCIAQTSPMQVSKNLTFCTHYHDYEALQVNPANIAANRREGKKVSFGMMQSNMLLFNRVMKFDLLHGGNIASMADAGHWIDDILVERTALRMDNTLLGLNFSTKKAGSFGLSVRSVINLDTEINGAFEDLEFEGGSFTNLPDIIMETIMENPDSLDPGENSTLKVSAVNEFNLGYSRRVVKTDKVQVFAGMGVKYLLGFADIGMQFNTHEVAGYYALSSLLPEDFDNEDIVGQVKSDKKFGHGFGGSIGVSMKANKWRAGMSVVDLGFIKWPSKYMYITKEDVIEEGITNPDVDNAISNVLREGQRGQNGTELLPAKMVIGGSYDAHECVSFYMDIITPVMHSPNGMSNPTIGAGTWLSAKGIITLKAGATLSTKKLITLPMYLSVFAGSKRSFEMSLGTSDLLSIFKPTREYLQVETAFMKFHF